MMKIIRMGGRVMGPMMAWGLVETFLAANFSQAERHLRRLGKVAALENQATREAAPIPAKPQQHEFQHTPGDNHEYHNRPN
jgi:hypothetical protein